MTRMKSSNRVVTGLRSTWINESSIKIVSWLVCELGASLYSCIDYISDTLDTYAVAHALLCGTNPLLNTRHYVAIGLGSYLQTNLEHADQSKLNGTLDTVMFYKSYAPDQCLASPWWQELSTVALQWMVSAKTWVFGTKANLDPPKIRRNSSSSSTGFGLCHFHKPQRLTQLSPYQ